MGSIWEVYFHRLYLGSVYMLEIRWEYRDRYGRVSFIDCILSDSSCGKPGRSTGIDPVGFVPSIVSWQCVHVGHPVGVLGSILYGSFHRLHLVSMYIHVGNPAGLQRSILFVGVLGSIF